MDHKDSERASPPLPIFITALLVGGVAFAVGFIGPAVFSESNLGPLLGIFVTGPVGTLVGALIGIVRSALHAGGRSIRAELWWLGFVWVLSLLYSLAYSLVGLGLVPLGLQGLVVASGAFLLGSDKVRKSLPELARKCGPVVLFAAVLIVFTSIFPPVMPPWWDPQHAQSRASASGPLPKFAFFRDRRFDASRHVPEFAVDRGGLARQWIAIHAIAGLVSLLIAARSKPTNAPHM
jgi:hypothetical protein